MWNPVSILILKETKQGYLDSVLLFENTLEILAQTIMQEKEVKCINIG